MTDQITPTPIQKAKEKKEPGSCLHCIAHRGAQIIPRKVFQALNVLVAKVKDFGRAQNKVGTIKDGLDYARMLRSHNEEKKNLQE